MCSQQLTAEAKKHFREQVSQNLQKTSGKRNTECLKTLQKVQIPSDAETHQHDTHTHTHTHTGHSFLFRNTRQAAWQ